MPGFDSHAHLHFNHFDNDLQNVRRRAEAAGITDVMIPSVDLPTSRLSAERALELGYFSSAGLHPEHLPAEDPQSEWRGIRRILIEAPVVAVGETGLDLHHRTFPLQEQIRWFHRHIELAQDLGYPLIIHSRKAEAEVLSELPKTVSVPVVLHCWDGDREQTASAVSRGFFIGVDGPITYRRNRKLLESLSAVPMELLLSETDSPFLPPEPHRGQRNEPAYAALVIRKVRELLAPELSIEGVSHQLWENAMRAFRLHPKDRRADIAYRYGESAYVNITSRCQNDCTFCIRRRGDGLAGYFLRHREDPPESLVLSTLDSLPLEDFRETVFCGFGEPTLRHDLLAECAERLSRRGIRVRLNTNGLCTSFLEDSQVTGLLSRFDSVSVSLNASGEKEYNRICLPSGRTAWEDLLRFIKLARASRAEVGVSAVKGSGADIHRVGTLASRLGLELRVRGG